MDISSSFRCLREPLIVKLNRLVPFSFLNAFGTRIDSRFVLSVLPFWLLRVFRVVVFDSVVKLLVLASVEHVDDDDDVVGGSARAFGSTLLRDTEGRRRVGFVAVDRLGVAGVSFEESSVFCWLESIGVSISCCAILLNGFFRRKVPVNVDLMVEYGRLDGSPAAAVLDLSEIPEFEEEEESLYQKHKKKRLRVRHSIINQWCIVMFSNTSTYIGDLL